MLPCKGRQRVAFTMLRETLHKLLYFSLLEGPILREGGTRPLESEMSPARSAGSGPHRLYTFLCAAWSSVIHLFREKQKAWSQCIIIFFDPSGCFM